MNNIKLRFSENDTINFDVTDGKSKWTFFSNFLAFSKNMNFNVICLQVENLTKYHKISRKHFT